MRKPVVKVIGVRESGSEALSSLRGGSWNDVYFEEAVSLDAAYPKEGFRGVGMTLILADIQNMKDADAAYAAAKCAKGMGALTIVIAAGEEVPKALADAADTVMLLPSALAGNGCGKAEAMSEGVRRIMGMLSDDAVISIDFADLKTCLSNVGVTAMVEGHASGPNAASRAVENAIALMGENVNLSKAKTVLMHIMGSGDDIRVLDVCNAGAFLCEQVNPNADIVWGVTEDDSMGEFIDVTLVGSVYAL